MKNYLKEFEDFVNKQIEINDEYKDLNIDWEGWKTLYLASKIDKIGKLIGKKNVQDIGEVKK